MVDLLYMVNIGKYTIPSTIPMDAMGMVRDRYILPFIRVLIYPPRNDHISHLRKFGKTSTQKYREYGPGISRICDRSLKGTLYKDSY